MLRALRVTWAARALHARGDGASLAVQGLPLAGIAVRLHGFVMLLYRYPLLTWIPVVLGLDVVALASIADQLRGTIDGGGVFVGLGAGVVVAVLTAAFFAVRLRGWTAAAVARERDDQALPELPASAAARLLPEPVARGPRLGGAAGSAHLVVDRQTGGLVWSKEVWPGRSWRHPRRSRSADVRLWPQDALGRRTIERRRRFASPVSRGGRRSLRWRAYERHYFTQIQDPVLAPTERGWVLAIAPYLRFRGFPVRRPYLAGVHVLHADGRLEDLTVDAARRRPEIAGSGCVVPEQLALEIARAHGRVWQGTWRADRMHDGTRAPYLTLLDDGSVNWVAVTHRRGSQDTLDAMVLTDATTAATRVWRPPSGARLLSDYGAARLVVDSTPSGTVCAPVPLFARGRLYYVASLVHDSEDGKAVDLPRLEHTVLVDAGKRRVIAAFDRTEHVALRTRLADLGVPS